MKTASAYQRVERQTEKPLSTPYDRMDAIACGVQARFEESTGYSRRVTDATINVARTLGVADVEIERWASHRLTRLAHDTERLREIKSLLDKLYGNSFHTTAQVRNRNIGESS